MKTINIKLFEFNELAEAAKQKALSEFADFNIMDNWYQFIFENFADLGKLLGLTISVKEIYFRGFYSQGDGSGFSADVDLPDLLKAIQNEQWQNEFPKTGLTLALPGIDRRIIQLIVTGKIDVTATIKKSTGFYAEDAELTEYLPQLRPRYMHIEAALDQLEKWLQQLADNLNRFLYKSLETECDYLTSEAAIIESIKVNEYYFTADGKSANRLQRLAGEQ